MVCHVVCHVARSWSGTMVIKNFTVRTDEIVKMVNVKERVSLPIDLIHPDFCALLGQNIAKSATVPLYDTIKFT